MAPFDEIADRYRTSANDIKDKYMQASTWLPFKAAEIKGVFTEEELDTVAALVNEMQKATDDNQRKTMLISKIDKYSHVIVKLLGIAGVY